MANDLTKIYVRDAGNNKYYQELDDGSGDPEYIPAEEGLQFEELKQRNSNGQLQGTGKYVEVNDYAERQRQRQADSHKAYFEALSKNPDPREARRAMKRLDKLESQFVQLTLDRASPVGAPQVRYVKDEQFMELMAQYQKDDAAGVTKSADYRETMFVPLAAYHHKISRIRPLYVGEVGVCGSEILCLEPGYGTGGTITVPAQIGSGPREE